MNKKIIFVSLTILIVIILSITLTIFLIPKEVTANQYFKSVTNSNHTKQIQHTIIKDDNILVYEKTETMIINNGKAYHKIEEKTLSLNSSEDYKITVTEFFYANNKKYSFENNEWQTTDFNLNTQLKTYNLKEEYFNNLSFDKKIEETGKLTGTIKNENSSDVFGNANLQDVSLTIVVNKSIKILSFEVSAKNTTDKTVTISNSYTYDNETVTLPI